MSDLLEPLFGDPEVSAHFTDLAQVRAMLAVEVALAHALSETGIAPSASAAAVDRAARTEAFDLAALAAGAGRAGNLAIPLVEQLVARVAAIDPEASKVVHHGATSQDILDTGLVLQLRAAIPIVVARLRRIEQAAADLARRHATTVMPARTWLQQATPTTFGLKAAGWSDAVGRCARRLEIAAAAAEVLQLGGAAGTLAALGDRGVAVAEALGRRLQLPVPALPWHAHRDRFAELGCALGIATGELGKIGRDLALLAQTEVGEVAEAASGGSSTRPQKRNPIGAAVALAASHRAPGLVATLLSAMVHEHERGIGGWQAEWETLPQLIRLTGGAARAVADAVATLVVDPERMGSNLERSDGLISAEAVATALAPKLGRPRAYALVAAACRRAAAEHVHLRVALDREPEIAAALGASDLDRLFRPESYLGSTAALIERTLGRRQERPGPDA
jgi:3-carboxy-cis,cis-muconate cycloisomerase